MAFLFCVGFSSGAKADSPTKWTATWNLSNHQSVNYTLNPNAFDGRGNYALGIKEQLIFPEIEYDKVDKVRGMDIIFVTTAKTDEEARELLTLFNMPFAK